MTTFRTRRERVQELVFRAIPKLKDPTRFSTHELLNVIKAMDKTETAGIPSAGHVIRRISNPLSFAMVIRGFPNIKKHDDGIISMQSGIERIRSQMWTFVE
jgi:hypothetical protein